MSCEYNTQGFYKCNKKEPEANTCEDKDTGTKDNTLKYIAQSTHYDMYSRYMAYQLRVTPDGYRNFVANNKFS